VATDNATGSPQSVPLSGIGEPIPTVSFSPTSLSFPATAPGEIAAAQTLTVTNTSTTTAISATSYRLSGANANEFFIHASTCTDSLPAGASCTLSIAFKPNTPGSATASFVATDNASGSPQSVPLTGTGN
jgi:uncharacterized membrane protein